MNPNYTAYKSLPIATPEQEQYASDEALNYMTKGCGSLFYHSMKSVVRLAIMEYILLGQGVRLKRDGDDT